jgi:hypothetical protein
MKRKYKTLIVCLTILLIGCGKRNFFPDEDDPGLSLLTSRGYNIATMYINNVPYINTYHKPFLGGIINSVPTVRRRITNSAFDTLEISWQIKINDSSNSYNQPYHSISLLMPVSKNFTAHDFLAMSGKRFEQDTNAIAINSFYNFQDTLSGKSNVYFVAINYNSPANSSARTYSLSGLFNGNIGDSILITKGRFDFKIDAGQINF